MKISIPGPLGNFADCNLSSTELESGNALGAFLQTPALVLDIISGPKGAESLSSAGLGLDNLIEREREREQFFPVPALDENQSPKTHGRFRTPTPQRVAKKSGRTSAKCDAARCPTFWVYSSSGQLSKRGEGSPPVVDVPSSRQFQAVSGNFRRFGGPQPKKKNLALINKG